MSWCVEQVNRCQLQSISVSEAGEQCEEGQGSCGCHDREQETRAAVAVTVKSKGSTVGGCVGATNVMRTMAVDHGAMFPTVI